MNERAVRYDEFAAGVFVDITGYRGRIWLVTDDEIEWYGELRATVQEAAEDAAIALVMVFEAEADEVGAALGVNVRKVGSA